MSYVNSVCESMTTFCQGETMTVHKQPWTWHVTRMRARASPCPARRFISQAQAQIRQISSFQLFDGAANVA